ncbi:NADAR protein [Fadolivirus algeromassiliense]|jgi:ribA/ribD-fused uncharacterized protein|uniref:NADAR protein n=1 Tax=Fadolivirus FV1/VV64 TaxID=3070911 RepID=A0A7D3URF3_9VIRU|nr:NADAR protein [Fadolivirus algeromassiliense]QKF94593.1 NADAR protein [Fadolivirus FV1/VV64]
MSYSPSSNPIETIKINIPDLKNISLIQVGINPSTGKPLYNFNFEFNNGTIAQYTYAQAQQIFDNSGIGSFGRTTRRPMKDALHYWLTQQQQQQQQSQPQPQPQPSTSVCNYNNRYNNVIRPKLGKDVDRVCFYHSTDPYYQFTNFYHAPYTIGNNTYTTSEHYFQAQKFTHYPEIFNQIVQSSSPSDALRIATTNKNNVINGWINNNLSIKAMREAIRYKFDAYANFRQDLIDTDGKILEEHSDKDKFYGVYDSKTPSDIGENMLGRLLMELRNFYVNSSQHPDPLTLGTNLPKLEHELLTIPQPQPQLTLKCEKCGAMNIQNANYCDQCGFEFKKAQLDKLNAIISTRTKIVAVTELLSAIKKK